VGIQVEIEDGQTEMRHSDLPFTATTYREIVAQVDGIIASHSELLTQRRHQKALVQLLGRLYNIEVGADRPDEQPESPRRTSGGDKGKHSKAQQRQGASDTPQPADSDTGTWRLGQEVVLVGLQGPMQVHNGEVGRLDKVHVGKGKCEVTLHDNEEGGSTKIKGLKHILPVASGAGPMVTGTPVVICRLRNHSELNGWPGRILEKSEEQNRYVVRAAGSGQLFQVVPASMVERHDGQCGIYRIRDTHAGVASKSPCFFRQGMHSSN